MTVIDTDYLVVGSGAAGMAFTDALIAESDADVVMVDRRHRPGGHWNDAYRFVRLHQPSAFYGINSQFLGNDTIDEIGPNAGLYERATAADICAYYERALDEHLLASGQVRFFGMSDYVGVQSGEHRFVSRLTGEATTVRVRRKVVDATYLETSVPSTHTPSFAFDYDVRLIPVNGLVNLTEPGTGYTVIGSGKTAMDACIWLLDNGVVADAIRWVRPVTRGSSTARSSSRSSSCPRSSTACRSGSRPPRTRRASAISSRGSKRADSSPASTRASNRRCTGARP
jgi:hypothetical protein